jgi:hypothetical protein
MVSAPPVQPCALRRRESRRRSPESGAHRPCTRAQRPRLTLTAAAAPMDRGLALRASSGARAQSLAPAPASFPAPAASALRVSAARVWCLVPAWTYRTPPFRLVGDRLTRPVLAETASAERDPRHGTGGAGRDRPGPAETPRSRPAPFPMFPPGGVGRKEAERYLVRYSTQGRDESPHHHREQLARGARAVVEGGCRQGIGRNSP